MFSAGLHAGWKWEMMGVMFLPQNALRYDALGWHLWDAC